LNPVNDDYIKTKGPFAQYVSGSWIGPLTQLSDTLMYKIRLADSQVLSVVGNLLPPGTTTIPYGAGWRWISYIPHISMSVNQALSNRISSPGDFIKNQGEYAFYVNSTIGWIGSLDFMNPGDGFMLYSANNGSFTYPDYATRWQDDFIVYERPEVLNPPTWIVNDSDFEYTASVTAELLINGTTATSGNYVVAAFVGDECRGTAIPINVAGTWLHFLTVFSNTQNETIELKIYSGDMDTIFDTGNSFSFANDLILGSPSAPYQIAFAGGLSAPTNVTLQITNTSVIINWDDVADAHSYKIYASDSIMGGFTDVSDTGTFNSTSWTVGISSTSRYYYVVSSTESPVLGGGRGSTESDSSKLMEMDIDK